MFKQIWQFCFALQVCQFRVQSSGLASTVCPLSTCRQKMETLTTATAQKMKSVLNQSAKQTVNPQKRAKKDKTLLFPMDFEAY